MVRGSQYGLHVVYSACEASILITDIMCDVVESKRGVCVVCRGPVSRSGPPRGGGGGGGEREGGC